MISLLLVDDQTLVRQALASLLSLEDDLKVLGQADSNRAALQLLHALQNSGQAVDVALVDIEMGSDSGLDLTREIKQAFPDTKVLIVTTFGRPGYLSRALSAGASGFIVKDTPAEQLVSIIRNIYAGAKHIDPKLAADALAQGPNPLTPREIETLSCALTGASIDQIAATVFLAPGTVRNIISGAMTKLGAKSRIEAAQTASAAGWL